MYIFKSKQTLRIALKAFCHDANAVEEKYGAIGEWILSEDIVSLSELFNFEGGQY